jgi:NAD-dependent dihydropyrimidine dehydrogenase PreA subunit
MSEEIYRNLQEHLHQHPMGFPSTKNGAEIQLLKKLFEPDEAKIAIFLTPKPETAEQIAAKIGEDSQAMFEKLDRMARKGLIMRRKQKDAYHFNLEPYVGGIFDFQLARLDREVIDLDNKYKIELGVEFFGSQTPYWRVIPVERNIPNDVTVLSHQRVSELVEKTDKIAVTDCICRTRQKISGQVCDRTRHNCIFLSHWANYLLENGWPGREISKVEALEIFAQAEEEGLVHTTQNTASGPTVICNCCSCCCSILKPVKFFKMHNRVGRSEYFAKANEDLCTGCKECVDRCQFGALSVDADKIIINHDFCMGCGLCATKCPVSVISLSPRPTDQIVKLPLTLGALFNQIGKEKGRPMKVTIE